MRIDVDPPSGWRPSGSDAEAGPGYGTRASIAAEGARLAAGLGATDVLVFRRVRRGTWVHVGGVGRGESWAGIIETDQADEPLVREALVSGHPARLLGGPHSRVVGPYYASAAALVRAQVDRLVVWGASGHSTDLIRASDVDLFAASRRFLALSGGSVPAQRLSDELEVLHAVQQVTAVIDQPLAKAVERVASATAESLSCELAAVWLHGGRYAVAQRGWALPAPAERVAEVLSRLHPGLGPARVVQDAWSAPLPAPVGPADGIVSYLVQPLSVPGGGVLLAAHTVADPRGFTSLCQRVAAQVAGAASVALQAAEARERLEDQLLDSHSRIREDALTGLASRHAWDEAMVRAQRLVDGGTPVTIALVDLDDLKAVNDSRGHVAGDALLRTCAQALRRCVRGDRDMVARLGGDEFALVVAGSDDATGFTERVRAELDAARTPDGDPVRASVGVAASSPGTEVITAFERADATMYRDKRARRSSSPSSPSPERGSRPHWL